jgi:hypothetical protein
MARILEMAQAIDRFSGGGKLASPFHRGAAVELFTAEILP